MEFTLPILAYSYDALQPHIDSQTMEIHHSKHHQGYTNKLNAALKEENIQTSSIEEILKDVSGHSTAIRNNGGGYYNHKLFWENIVPMGGGSPSGELLEAIKKDFKSFDQFKAEFEKAAATRFGSGWAWLLKCADCGKLKISSTPNQDNPLMDDVDTKGTPLLGLDVWEHAYYLKYQNKRPEYISAFWNIVNWKAVEKRFEAAK